MLPTNIKLAIVEEFIRVCEDPSNSGKFIAMSTLIRRIENRHGNGFCANVGEDEILDLVKKASGLWTD
jgi:hypothetical protein